MLVSITYEVAPEEFAQAPSLTKLGFVQFYKELVLVVPRNH
ncbi:MAG: hypothetical protein V7K40_28225 [Nostoc sp.]